MGKEGTGNTRSEFIRFEPYVILKTNVVALHRVTFRAFSKNRQNRKSVRDRHFGQYDMVDKSDLNSFTLLRILFARATTRAYPYFSCFHLARKQSWQSRRPLFDLDQTKSRHGVPQTFVDRLGLN